MQGCLYGSKVILFGHINVQRKPICGNRKYNWCILPRVREIFLHIARYQEIAIKPHYCIGLQGYFE